MSGFEEWERELLARIAGVFAALDPVPEQARRDAEDAALVLRPTRTWRRLELLRDNVMSSRERRMGFGPGGLDVRVRWGAGDRVALSGSVDGPAAPGPGGRASAGGGGVPAVGLRRAGRLYGAAAVWVRWPGGAGRSLVDASGRFDLAEVPAGPVCLAVTGKSAGMALTPWFVC